MEEDGALVEEAEKLCINFLPLDYGEGELIYCKKTGQVCYLFQDEVCEDYEPVTSMGRCLISRYLPLLLGQVALLRQSPSMV